MRVVTWNVHGCVGADGRRDPDRTAAVLARFRADIAAIQEIDTRRGRLGPAGRALGEAVGPHTVSAPSLSGNGGWYGQVILSRWPFLCSEVVDLSQRGFEPRRAIDALVRTPFGILRLIATHLGLNRWERRRQLAQLRDLLEYNGSRPTLLLGDFNEWLWPRRVDRALGPLVTGGRARPTFPRRYPTLALDRIFVHPPTLLGTLDVPRDIAAASDHLPVVATLDVAALAAAAELPALPAPA